MPRSTSARRWAWTCGPRRMRSDSGSGLIGSACGPTGCPSAARTTSSSRPARWWWPQEPARSCRRDGSGPGCTCCTRAPTQWRSGPAWARGCGSWSWAVAGSGARRQRRPRPGARRSTCSRLREACSPAGFPPRCPSGSASGWPASGCVCMRGRPVRSIEDSQGSLRVSGTRADLVLVALGVRPATVWLAESGVEQAPRGAVLVDPWGRSSAPGVFAVGDAADRWSPRYGTHLPGGHWTEALNAPETVAPAVAQWAGAGLGSAWWADPPPSLPAADPIPYVFSDIAARRLLVLGAPGEGRVVWREATPAAEDPDAWSAFTLDASDRLLGLCTSGRPRDLAVARRAMLAHPTGTPRTDPAALADPRATPAAMFPGEG